ncbi:MAG: hypothetical protein NZ901_09950 [Geminocystis sp.]|nr:hypothetical protein [Geminocystis sp.]MCS7148496.1 hypothetical protein [Geminocystis sp.]MCX8079452.1 hypothetical protein [Geminocystis sp.]MDW8114930.1 hypothetical protein [Geminocystis sp.]MDW8464197.1 hypothetical protein [Geminocystis sp.]
MAAAIKRLRDNIAIIHQQVGDIAQQLKDFYREYFPQLQSAVKRQIVQAFYHICTQKYPQAFLDLSYQDRYNLQQKIKELGVIFAKNLCQKLNSIEEIKSQPILVDLTRGILASLGEQGKEDSQIEGKIDNSTASTQLAPATLLRFMMVVENAVEASLLDVSQLANLLLQDARILPQNIPNRILEMALKAGENSSFVTGVPNILSVLIEKDEKSQEANVAPVVAVSLRLNEIEFYDNNLNSLRQRGIEIFKRLSALETEYQQLSQKLAVAEAESAWRASWCDD